MQEDKSKKLREEVFRRYETLPQELKQAMASAATAEVIYAIGKKFGLNIEKTGYLADVIGYTIIGIFPVADFMRNLKDMLEVDGAKAEEISREVNNKIFLAIREQLKKTHGEKWDERMLRQPTTNSQQPTTTPQPKPTTNNQQPITPAIPKSPWEIKPDGFGRAAGITNKKLEEKSVIPPQPKPTSNQPPIIDTVKTQEAEMKKAAPAPPEFLKTREAPQPAPAAQDANIILKEIRPTEQESKDRKLETKEIAPKPTALQSAQQQPATAKAAPPADLPFIKKIEKLAQTPDLKTTSGPIQSKTQKSQQPQPASSPKPPMPAPQPTAPDHIAQSGPPQTTAPTQKYNPDPYREPIE